MNKSRLLAVLLFSGFITTTLAQTLGPLKAITGSEFLKLSDGPRALYVGGAIDGMTFITYGYSIKDHDNFVQCARTIALGDLAKRTVAWLRSKPSFKEGAASAVASAMGAYCKEKGFR